MCFPVKILRYLIFAPYAHGRRMLIVLLAFSVLPPAARADLSVLRDEIVAFNLEEHKKALADGSYRGEAGILRIGPEVALSLGLQAWMGKDYKDARAFYEEADKYYEAAVEAMVTDRAEKYKGEHAQRIAESTLHYQGLLRSARESMAAYRAKITASVDQRLDETACLTVLEKMLLESLSKTAYNLRDALGFFYNRCQGLPDDGEPLTPENIQFVNRVFRRFKEMASHKDLNQYDLEIWDGRARNTDPGWKQAVGSAGASYVSIMEALMEAHKEAVGYALDPLLFFALIRQESNFNPRAISYVGAAGLTQIMPETGKRLGMKHIFQPGYYDDARSIMGREHQLRCNALAQLEKISPGDSLGPAKQARELMQRSLVYGRKRAKLYERYKRELLRQGSDDRLDPVKAIQFGYRYLVTLMKIQKGDMSLAVASYNAGPHRVKQYQGIPPYSETISFRNRILGFYRGYVQELER